MRYVYPQLPTGENFRLKQCSEWLAYLERELTTRLNIYKKYKRARSLLLNIGTASGTLSLALSAGGLAQESLELSFLWRLALALLEVFMLSPV